jgi:glycosyltransferase involved in cell wall biosynthesis
MEPQYGVDIAVKGFIDAQKENPNLRLLLYGKGSQEGIIHRLVHDAGVEDAVHFGGFAPLAALPDIYNSADIYLTASHTDGSSVSLMESLACGLPVIVSDIPSNMEWVCHGREGWLFEDGNIEDLARKIDQAISSESYWSNIAKHNRELAEENADWTKNFPVLLQAYEQALAIHREGRK